MAQGQGGKKGLIITIVVLAITLLVVGTVVTLQNLNRTKTVETSNQSTPTTNDNTDETSTLNTETSTEPTKPTVDPTTLSSIDVEPLKITVFYTKGVNSFEFAVKRTADKTQYVEFSSPELVGTKCTDDSGVFASIIQSPTSQAAVSQTVVVEGTTYGLSLSGKSCASDLTLLEKYQSSFSNGFSSLKVMQ